MIRSPHISPRKPTRQARAFTLIELLVGIIISTMIIGATYSAYIAVHDAWEQSRIYSRQYQQARVALSLIEQHLRAAIEPNTKAGIVFEGIDTPIDIFSDDASMMSDDSSSMYGAETFADTSTNLSDALSDPLADPLAEDMGPQSDRLRFVSTGNPVFPGSRLRSDICQVEFFISTPEDLLEGTDDYGVDSVGSSDLSSASSDPLFDSTDTDGTVPMGEMDLYAEPFVPALMMRRFPMPTESAGFSDDLEVFDIDSMALMLTEEETFDTALELASGVVSFNVQYFDGLDWLDEWITTDELPRAVEIRLVFAEPGSEANAVTVAKLITINTCTTEPVDMSEFEDIGAMGDTNADTEDFVDEQGDIR